MKIMEPIAITDALLISSDVPEDDAAAWSAAVDYATDAEVISTTTHRVYRAVQASGPGNGGAVDPTTDTDAVYWTDFGATNRWRCFDDRLNTQSSRAGSIQIELALSNLSDGLAFFNMEVDSIRVQVFNADSPAIKVYDQTFTMIDNSERVSWFRWFYAPIERRRRIVPTLSLIGRDGFMLRVTATRTGGTAKIGMILLCRTYDLGTVTAGTGVSFADFSGKDRDPFGNPVIAERPWVDKVSYTFMASTQQIQRIRSRIAANRVRPAVYVMDALTDQYGTTAYGIVDRFDAPDLGFNKTFCQLEIEGYA